MNCKYTLLSIKSIMPLSGDVGRSTKWGLHIKVRVVLYFVSDGAFTNVLQIFPFVIKMNRAVHKMLLRPYILNVVGKQTTHNPANAVFAFTFVKKNFWKYLLVQETLDEQHKRLVRTTLCINNLFSKNRLGESPSLQPTPPIKRRQI